jgi:hypothetical protein
MPTLLAAQKVSSPSKLQISYGNPESGPKIIDLLDGGESFSCRISDSEALVNQQVGIGLPFKSTLPAHAIDTIGRDQIYPLPL